METVGRGKYLRSRGYYVKYKDNKKAWIAPGFSVHEGKGNNRLALSAARN
jgi:hypothetical protein